mgnify:FL=1
MLAALEENEHGNFKGRIQLPSWSDEQVGYHGYLIIEEGFAKGTFTDGFQSPSPEGRLRVLTPKGHDFLDATRDQGVWDETKRAALKLGGTLTIGMMLELAKTYLRLKLGLPV